MARPFRSVRLAAADRVLAAATADQRLYRERPVRRLVSARLRRLAAMAGHAAATQQRVRRRFGRARRRRRLVVCRHRAGRVS